MSSSRLLALRLTVSKKVGDVRAFPVGADAVVSEYFSIFAEDIPSQGLGGIDTRATSIDLNINGRDLTIHQSPSILTSQRAGGTTGAGESLKS